MQCQCKDLGDALRMSPLQGHLTKLTVTSVTRLEAKMCMGMGFLFPWDSHGNPMGMGT